MSESISETQPSCAAFVEIVVSCDCVDEAISICLPLLKKASTHLRAAGALLERLRIRPGAVENDDEVKSVCRVLKRYVPPSAAMAEMALSLLPLISPGKTRQEVVHLVTHFAVGDEEVAVHALNEYRRLLQYDVSLLVPVIGSLQQLPLPPAACDSGSLGSLGERNGAGATKMPHSSSNVPGLSEAVSAEELSMLALRIVDEDDVPAVVQALLRGFGGERARGGEAGGTISAIRHETCDVSLQCQAVLMTVLKQGLTMNAAAARAFLRAVAADPNPLLPIDALAILILLPRPQHAALLERTLMPIASTSPHRLPWKAWEGVCTSPELDGFDEVIPAALDLGLWLLTVPLRRSSREDRVFHSRKEGGGNEEGHAATHDLELLFSNTCRMLENIFVHYPSQRGRLVACLVSIASNDVGASYKLARGNEKADDFHLQCCCTTAAELLLELVRNYPSHLTTFSGVVGDAVMSAIALGGRDYEPLQHGTELLCSSTTPPIIPSRAQELLAATAANLASYAQGLSLSLQIHLQKMLLSNNLGSAKGGDPQLFAVSLAEQILEASSCNTSEFSEVLAIVSRFVEFGFASRSQNIEAPLRALRLVVMFAEKYNFDDRKTGGLLLGSGNTVSSFISELVQEQGILQVVRLTQGRCEEGVMMMHPVPSCTTSKCSSSSTTKGGGGITSSSMSKGKAENVLAINVIGKARQIVEGHLLGAPQLICRLTYAFWLSKLESASPGEVDKHLRAQFLLPLSSSGMMRNQLFPSTPWHVIGPLPVDYEEGAAMADCSVLLLEGVSWGISAAVLAASAEFCALKRPELNKYLGWTFLEAMRRLRCAVSELESRCDPSEDGDQGGVLLLTEFCRLMGRLLPIHALWCCCSEVKDGEVGGDPSTVSIQAGCEAFELLSLSLLKKGSNDEDWLVKHKCSTGSIYDAAAAHVTGHHHSGTNHYHIGNESTTSISNSTENLMRLEMWLISAENVSRTLSKVRTSKRRLRPKPSRDGSVASSDEPNDINLNLLHRFLLAHLASIVVVLRHMQCFAAVFVKEPIHEKLCSIILQNLRVSESPTCACLLLDALSVLSMSTVDTTTSAISIVVSEAWKVLTTVYPLSDSLGIGKGGRRVNTIGTLQFPQASTLGFEQAVLDLLRNSRAIHYAARRIGVSRDSSLLCPTTLRRSAEIARWVCFSICWASCHAIGRVEVLSTLLSACCRASEGGSEVERIDLEVLLSLLIQFLRLLPLTVSLGGPFSNTASSKSTPSPFEGLEKAVKLLRWTLEAVEMWITIPGKASQKWQSLQRSPPPSKRIKSSLLKSSNNKDLQPGEEEEEVERENAVIALEAVQKRSHALLRSCIRALKVARDKLTDCINWRNTVSVDDVG